MRRAAFAISLVFVAAFADGVPARAASYRLGGDRLILRDAPKPERRRVTFLATRDPQIQVGREGDPRVTGATLEVVGAGPGDGATGVIALAAARWRGLGRPAGSRGWVYEDRAATNGVSKVTLKPGRRSGSLAVTGRGAAWSYAITQPQAAVEVRLTIGGDRYCADFRRFTRNEIGRVEARDASPPERCGGPPVCGNGSAERGEGCDDGNVVDGDGCSATCVLETKDALCAGVPGAPDDRLALALVADGLELPTHVTASPLDTRRLFVVEQRGRIRIVQDGVLRPEPFLTIDPGEVGCCEERGLLSVAFHPDYARNGRFFVYYVNFINDIVIAEYARGADADHADAGSERILLSIQHQPFLNHYGGQLAFGPDGYLYVSVGDGGAGGDPQENGQNTGALLGKLLRLDVDAGPPWIPSTNPFVGPGDPRDEIWATGLRNPWRFSFDRGTGDLYLGDVGQLLWEEIDVQPAESRGGENYGWDVFEGRHCFVEFANEAPQECPRFTAGYTMPIVEYGHGDGSCAVTGGFVYRGCRIPALRGTYFYSDFCRPFFRTFRGVSVGVPLEERDRTVELTADLTPAPEFVASFGEDARGEIYVVDLAGRVFKIVPAP